MYTNAATAISTASARGAWRVTVRNTSFSRKTEGKKQEQEEGERRERRERREREREKREEREERT